MPELHTATLSRKDWETVLRLLMDAPFRESAHIIASLRLQLRREAEAASGVMPDAPPAHLRASALVPPPTMPPIPPDMRGPVGFPPLPPEVADAAG